MNWSSVAAIRFAGSIAGFTLTLLALGTAPAQQVQLHDLGPSTVDVTQPAPLVESNRLMASGDFKQAEAELRTYLLRDVGSAPARYMLAYSLLRQNRPKDSLEQFTRAAALATPSAEQLRYVAQDYVLLADYTDASKWFLRSIQMNENDPETWYGLGRLRYTEQRYVDAADCFKRALVLAPKSVKIENNLGLSYEGLNRTDDAVVAYKQAIAWQDEAPSEKATEQPFLNLAIVLIHQGTLTKALPLLQRAAAIAPSDPRILEQIGQLYTREGKYTEASEALATATRLDPEKSNLHFLLGQAYRHLGRQQEANKEFAAAARLANPTSTP